MRRPRRLVTALVLLAGGTGIALVSHRRLDTSVPFTAPDVDEPSTSLGSVPLDVPEEAPQPAHLSGQIESTETPERDRVDGGFAPDSQSAAPPCEPAPLGDDPWRPSTRMASYQASPVERREPPVKTSTPTPSTPPSNNRPTTFTTHRIADGDTLSRLAQRYLGSGSRFREIFDANRDRLPSPDLLPIGVVIRIPGASAAPAAPTE
ncbi:MAG TPA: LysM peptidoglycan-binding domain-containing protein [Pirellulales bacterium]|nr:LysM peptidoglycan-binding domain-containing protein [Pirellulales bacterium]